MKKAIWCCLLFLSMSSFIHTLVAIKTTAGAEHPAQPIALIKEVKVQGNRIDISIEDAFKAVYLKTDFFAEYDPEVDLSSLDYSIVTLPFILNVLPIVWISGKHYTIDVMDETLYHALEKIREVFRRLYPHTAWDGILQPTSLVNNSGRFHYKNPQEHRAILFSAGLDSTCSSFYHYDKQQLLITAWGQWDLPLKREGLWHERKNSFIEFAQLHGHTAAFIRSNFATFLNWKVLNSLSPEIMSWRLDTTEGLGMFGLAAPLLAVKGYKDLYIASSYSWDYPYPSAANPLIDNNAKFAGDFRLIHDQFDFNRHEKIEFLTRFIQEKALPYPYLKVCDGRRSDNCCGDECSKCMQTIASLLALNENPHSYGLDIPKEEAIPKMQDYLSHNQLYWTLWNFDCIVRKLKDVQARGLPIDPAISWLLHVDLSQHIERTYLGQKKIVNWQEFKDLAPADLIIPPIKPQELTSKTHDIKGEMV